MPFRKKPQIMCPKCHESFGIDQAGLSPVISNDGGLCHSMEEFLEQRERVYRDGTALFKDVRIQYIRPGTVIIPVDGVIPPAGWPLTAVFTGDDNQLLCDGVIQSSGEPLTAAFGKHDYRYRVECPGCGGEAVCWWRGSDSIPWTDKLHGQLVMYIRLPWGKKSRDCGSPPTPLKYTAKCPHCNRDAMITDQTWYTPPLTHGDEHLTTLCHRCGREFWYPHGYDLYAGTVSLRAPDVPPPYTKAGGAKTKETDLVKELDSLLKNASCSGGTPKGGHNVNLPDGDIIADGSDPAELGVKHSVLRASMSGDYRRVLHECEEGLRTAPSSVYLLYMRGRTKADLGRYEEAVCDLDAVLSVRPRDSEVLCEKAKVMFDTGKYEAAVSYALQAARIDPEYYLYIAMTMHGAFMSTKGSYDGALDWFEKALSCKPDDKYALFCKVQVLVWKGNELLSEGKRDDALVCYRRALRIKPGFKPAILAVEAAESSDSLK